VDDLELLLERPAWVADANCRGLDPELFFPERGVHTDEAKAVCRRCDVQVECLTYAINLGEKHGIWGGMSERERRRIRRHVRIANEDRGDVA
jgi:WhiB family redox-sensing transcriptional regulator